MELLYNHNDQAMQWSILCLSFLKALYSNQNNLKYTQHSIVTYYHIAHKENKEWPNKVKFTRCLQSKQPEKR